MSESLTVARCLAREVGARRLDFDRSQADSAARLDRLADALHRDARPRRRSLAGRLRAGMRRLSSRPETAPVRGVYLWGAVGRGKTHLMDLFYESLRFPDRERSHFYRFMRRVHAELRAQGRQSDPLEAVANRLAREARLICLDEFFVSDIADAMLLGGLFRGLFRRGVTLVATSNVAPGDLYKDGLQRQQFLPAIELIEQHLEVLHLDGGTDYRLRNLQRAAIYLDANLPASAQALRELWAALGGAAADGPVDLAIEGRTIRAQRLGAGMAWFEFAELCDGPRSQNDYIELAHTYQTIFVSNVPRLGREHENAARRFLMLIDELYDRGVKLVLSAAAPPRDLYRGDRLRFEFERAVSRLIEMQTERYLSGDHRP